MERRNMAPKRSSSVSPSITPALCTLALASRCVTSESPTCMMPRARTGPPSVSPSWMVTKRVVVSGHAARIDPTSMILWPSRKKVSCPFVRDRSTMRYCIRSCSTASGCGSSRTKVPSTTSRAEDDSNGARTVPVSTAGDDGSSSSAGRSGWVMTVSSWMEAPLVRPAS